MNLLPQLVTEGNMAKDNANELLKAYGVPFTKAGELIEVGKKLLVTSEDDNKGMKVARETRLELRKHRITIEKRHDELKADSLRTGRAIDLVQRVALAEIKPVEEHLQLQEDFAKVQQELRHTKLVEERRARLSEWAEDTSIYNFDDMADEAFEALLESLKTAREAQLLAVENAEKERVAQEKKDAKEKKAQEEADRIARIKAEKELEKQREITRNANEEAQKALATAKELQDAENQRVVNEQARQAKEEAEEKARIDRIAEEAKKADSAPDKEKLFGWIEGISYIPVKPTTFEGMNVAKKISTHFAQVLEQYRQLIEKEL